MKPAPVWVFACSISEPAVERKSCSMRRKSMAASASVTPCTRRSSAIHFEQQLQAGGHGNGKGIDPAGGFPAVDDLGFLGQANVVLLGGGAGAGNFDGVSRGAVDAGAGRDRRWRQSPRPSATIPGLPPPWIGIPGLERAGRSWWKGSAAASLQREHQHRWRPGSWRCPAPIGRCLHSIPREEIDSR